MWLLAVCGGRSLCAIGSTTRQLLDARNVLDVRARELPMQMFVAPASPPEGTKELAHPRIG
jgi:hypothetical protein